MVNKYMKNPQFISYHGIVNQNHNELSYCPLRMAIAKRKEHPKNVKCS
jgi:hypothetical protein